jgi:putative adhesin
MKKRITGSAIYQILILSAIFISILPASASSVQGTFQRTFQVSGPVDLEVLTRSGDITVGNGPAGTVTISGKIHVGDRWFNGGKKAEVDELEKNPPLRQTGNSIRIDYMNVRDISIDYEITVPPEVNVRAHTGSGDQRVEGLRGKIDLESGAGDLRLVNLTGEIHTQTGSGNVESQKIFGPFTASSGTGDIRLQESGDGDVDIRTGSGNIELSGVRGALRANAGSGDISADGTPARAWEIKTGSGNVTLRVPSESGFDLDLSTSSGTIVVDQPVVTTVQGRVQEQRKNVSGKVHGGGPLLRVHTGSGDIEIR